MIRRWTLISLKWLLVVLFILIGIGCDKYRPIISHYDDPSRTYEGYTYFQTVMFSPGLYKMTMDGEVVWHRKTSIPLKGHGLGFEVLEGGQILALLEQYPTIIDTVTDTVLWEHKETRGHHSICSTPNGSVLIIAGESFSLDTDEEPWAGCVIHTDVIKEIDIQSNQVIWEWHFKDYFDPRVSTFKSLCDKGEVGQWVDSGDWTHGNTVNYYTGYTYLSETYNAILLNVRNLDMIVMIDHDTGDVIVSFGQNGEFGSRQPPEEPLFKKPHEVEMLVNGNFIMYDNRNLMDPFRSRALEISIDPVAQTIDEVWSWTQPQEINMSDTWGGDVNRLPNGNTLISNPGKGRIFEVDFSGEKVWALEMYNPALRRVGLHQIYMAERVPYDE